jgi:hypothetical protein
VESKLGQRVSLSLQRAHSIADLRKLRGCRAACSTSSTVELRTRSVYGLAAAGEPGAIRALEILREGFTRTLRLCGCRSVKEVDSRLLAAQ